MPENFRTKVNQMNLKILQLKLANILSNESLNRNCHTIFLTKYIYRHLPEIFRRQSWELVALVKLRNTERVVALKQPVSRDILSHFFLEIEKICYIS